jgi:hypothetical protein
LCNNFIKSDWSPYAGRQTIRWIDLIFNFRWWTWRHRKKNIDKENKQKIHWNEGQKLRNSICVYFSIKNYYTPFRNMHQLQWKFTFQLIQSLRSLNLITENVIQLKFFLLSQTFRLRNASSIISLFVFLINTTKSQQFIWNMTEYLESLLFTHVYTTTQSFGYQIHIHDNIFTFSMKFDTLFTFREGKKFNCEGMKLRKRERENYWLKIGNIKLFYRILDLNLCRRNLTYFFENKFFISNKRTAVLKFEGIRFRILFFSL